MKKWIIPLLIAVLFVGAAASGFSYVRQATIAQNHEILITGLQTDLASTKEEITSLNGTLQIMNENISRLLGAVGSLQTDLQTLSDNVTTLSGSLNSLQQASSSSGLFADFTGATDKVKPSVVVIETQIVTTLVTGRRITQQAAGSGWIISSDGIIVTNSHVIANAASVKVTLADGRSFTPIAIKSDTATDLAVLRIFASNLPAVKVGNSEKLQVGQSVAAIGNAVGRGINMSGGWVSRLNTSITLSDGLSLSGLIGTDAAINPGNSGGPLINIDGEVIGITNAKLVQTGVEGIGYAISINDAIKTINGLISQL